MRRRRPHHASYSHTGVAPPDLLRTDFRLLDQRETLRTTWPNEQLLLIQSVIGHAYEGHGAFRGRRFPNTTMDDICRALRLDPFAVQEDRQTLIDEITGYVDRTIAGDPPPALLADGDEPLLGISTLRFIRADPADVLRGIYLGGLRDQPEIRFEVEAERGIRVGGGRSYHVDYERMERAGLSGEDLAKGEWEQRIARLRQDGIIVEPERERAGHVVYQYIRYRKGPGASDDTAICAAGLLWGLGVAVGVFLADAIDTLEKYVPVYSDQDFELAQRIERDFADLRLGREDAKKLTFLAAGNDAEGAYSPPDSSLRHMLSVDRREDLCAIESHLLFASGVPAPRLGIGHDRQSSHEFYEYVRERVDQVD